MARKPRQDFSVSKVRQLSLSLTLPFSSSSFSIEAPNKASTFGHHFCPKSQKEGISGVVKCVSTSGTSKFQNSAVKIGAAEFWLVQKNACVWLAVERVVQNEFWMFASRSQRSKCRIFCLCSVLLGCDSLYGFECRFVWMLWKLGRIDGDPVLRETRIWATWEYVSSDGGGQQGWWVYARFVDVENLLCTIARPPPSTTCDGVVPGDMSRGSGDLGDVRRAPGSQQIKGTKTTKQGGLWWLASCEFCVICGLWPLIVMAAQLIRDRVEMECLEGVWETLEGNTRCRFRGTIRFTATSLVHPDEPARTLQRTVEWILPTPTPYRLVEPVQVIEVTSSEEDPEEDLEELPPEPAMDALDFLEGDEDPLLEVDSLEEVMSASEADSTEDSGPGEMAISGGSSS
ncbi:hypothetical protein GmHk_15G044642 [Glycine max]|nr:hypothetical protein GmHk_15G044642 [Glycine max]